MNTHYNNRFNAKQMFRQYNLLIQLIIINVAVFLLVNIVDGILWLMAADSAFSLVDWLAVPAAGQKLLMRFWTPFTYMFLHQDFLHILFNMLWLYWFGIIFLQYLDTKKLLSVYILGGLSGALFFIVAFNTFPAFSNVLEFSQALGASASVLAVVIAISVYRPDHRIHLLFLGPVKIKWIAIISIVLDLVSIKSANSGGHIAHLGGALFGFLYIRQWQKGNDMGVQLHRMLDTVKGWFTNQPKMNVSHRAQQPPVNDMDYNARKKEQQEEIDRILDKISKSGYDSLTKREKEFLFRMSDND